MNKQKLLEEIFDSSETGRLRQASLEAGLLAMRRKRRQRTAARCAASVCVLVLMAAGLARVFERNVPMRPAVSVTAPASPALARKGQANPDVEIINADQLLALFPNRPVALIGSPGRQKLIFLDETGRNSNF